MKEGAGIGQAAPADRAAKHARIEHLRARYEALRAQAQPESFAARVAVTPRLQREITPEDIKLDRIIPPGWYWYGRVPAGVCLRFENDLGTPGVSCLFWNALDPSERFNAADTLKVQWTAAIGRGRLLLSDMGRALASIVEDMGGWHDALLGQGPPRADDEPSAMECRNAHENLVLAATKLGLGPRDLHAPITFFAAVRCGPDQRFFWDSGISFAGTYVDLHAEMDLLVAASNTPHPMAPASVPLQAVRLKLWKPGARDIADFCHVASPEARRAFAETETYLAERHGS